ncbi:MAG: Polyribonucleotide 5'-hydroxyl-kinase [Promethearchaeota archaeon]|nr:MAG: Polyribonucleotide 5'-hydroxyl-kinase [Candidatus Lokiarchaeota archaeon]
MIKELKQGETLIAKGPTRINILEGMVEVFGKLISADEGERGKEGVSNDTELIIPSADQYPVYATEESKIEIYTSNPEENIKTIEENSIPKEWIDIKDNIIKLIGKSKESHPLKIMVLGLSHGKTTLIKYLANSLKREGLNGGYLDSDLGQQMMYAPTTISIASIEESIISGEDLDPAFTKFIGATYPKENLKFIVSHATNNLIEKFIAEHQNSDFILVDTDGWIKSEPGVVYKLFFIKTVEPDAIIVFHDDDIEELKVIEKKIKSDKQKELFLLKQENKYYYEKDKEDRRFLRQSRFSKVLSDFQKITIPLDDIKFVKNEYDKEQNKIIERDIPVRHLVTLPYHYVLISLLDENSQMIKIGLLFSINLEKNYFLIFSDLSYTEQLEVRKVLIGSLRLSTKGNHQGYLYL